VSASSSPAKSRGLPPGTALILLAFWLAGCGGLRVTDRLERDLASGDYAAGIKTIEEAKAQYAGPNSLLYYLDLGSFYQRAGDYARSNQALEQAELLIDELYTKSLSESVASFLVNDTSLSYSGEDFEQVMVNILKALNYLYLGDWEGAQVEARKVNNRLLALSDRYGDQAVYRQDGFARYLSAFAYEAGGQYNDAYIDYKKAYQAYQTYASHYGTPVPRVLQSDLLRLSRWLDFRDEYRRWRETFGADSPVPPPRPRKGKRGELLLVVYDGLMPAKRTRYVKVPVRDADDHPYLLKVAFPVFVPRPPAISALEIGLPDERVDASEVMEPVADIAIQNLEQRIGLISAKAIARATAKYIAAVQARRAARQGGQGLGLLVDIASNVYTLASEQADTRSWRMLPNRFQLIRVRLPAGTQVLPVRIRAFSGGARPGRDLEVELQAGEKKVIPWYQPR